MNNQGIFSRAITWLFGANWSTSLPGYVTVIALAIHEKPVLIGWMPEPAKGVIWNLTEYIFGAGILVLANRAKSKNVTGGNIQQDAQGQIATPQEATPAPPKPALPDSEEPKPSP